MAHFSDPPNSLCHDECSRVKNRNFLFIARTVKKIKRDWAHIYCWMRRDDRIVIDFFRPHEKKKKDETHIINQQCRRRRLKGDTHNVVIFHEKNSSVAQRRRQDREKVLVMMISLRRRVVRRWSRRGTPTGYDIGSASFSKEETKKKVYFFPHPFSPSTRSPMFLKWPFSFWYISTARLRTGVREQQRILVEKKVSEHKRLCSRTQ